MDLIWKHTSGGELWQGGERDVAQLIEKRDLRIDVVGLMAMNFQPRMPSHYRVIRGRLIDEPTMSNEAAALTLGIADLAASDLSFHMRLGRNVLSSCRAGRNRSGLVSGLTLVKLGMPPEAAVELVRARRVNADGPALDNLLFVRLIHDSARMGDEHQPWVDLRDSVRSELHH